MKTFSRRAPLALGLTFALFSGAVGLGWLRGFDRWALRESQSRPSAGLDLMGGLLSLLGDAEVSGSLLAALLVFLFLGGRRALSGRLLIAFIVVTLVEVVVKTLLYQPPLPADTVRPAGPSPLVAVSLAFSYPSGHMLRFTVLLGAVYLLRENRMLGALLLLALLGMAASRVYLGVHWASDVIGGALLGAAGLAWAFQKRKGEA